jgi:CheY-like chemotaxis protein
MVRVEIADIGPGIAAEAAGRIFEPFYTTKPAGAGTGIGLSYSQGVVEAHGGRLELARSSPEGSVFAVILPCAAVGAITAPVSRSPADVPPRVTDTVLVVDDEEDLLEALCGILRREGYRALTARSGHEAQALLGRSAVNLVITDIRMPDLDGPGLFAWLQAMHPELAERTVFLTGDTLGADAVRFLERSGRPYLAKPFTAAAVRQILKRAAL